MESQYTVIADCTWTLIGGLQIQSCLDLTGLIAGHIDSTSLQHRYRHGKTIQTASITTLFRGHFSPQNTWGFALHG